MKIGDLVKYFDMDGDVIYGVVISDVFMNTNEFDGEAIRVAWTDDAAQTVERLETLLDPEEGSIEFV